MGLAIFLLIGVELGVGLAVAKVIAAEIGGDLIEPGAKALGVAQAVSLAMGADKALLAEVAGVFGVFGIAEDKIVEAALPAPDQGVEDLGLAGDKALDEIGVVYVV
jgi:hypothetical protein